MRSIFSATGSLNGKKIKNGETIEFPSKTGKGKLSFKNNRLTLEFRTNGLPVRDLIANASATLEITNPGDYKLELRRNIQMVNVNGRRVQFNSTGSSNITVEPSDETDSQLVSNDDSNDDEGLEEKISDLEKKYEKIFGGPINAQKFFKAQSKGLKKLKKKLEKDIKNTSESMVDNPLYTTEKDKLQNKKKRVQSTLTFIEQALLLKDHTNSGSSLFNTPKAVSLAALEIRNNNLQKQLPMLAETVLTSAATSFVTGGSGIYLSLAVNAGQVYSAYSLVEDLEDIQGISKEQKQLIETLKENAKKKKKGEISEEQFKDRIKEVLKRVKEKDNCEGGCK